VTLPNPQLLRTGRQQRASARVAMARRRTARWTWTLKPMYARSPSSTPLSVPAFQHSHTSRLRLNSAAHADTRASVMSRKGPWPSRAGGCGR